MPDLAAIAYAHAAAVLGPGRAAEEAAILGLRRGGRSRSSVLGHTRHEALARAGQVPPVDLDAAEPEDLADLARLLTFTRPAVERAVVDLDSRRGLDRAGLGRALGLAPAAAAARAAEVVHVWQRTLDPVVLARLGPGACEDLAALLAPVAAAAPAAAADGDAAPAEPPAEPPPPGTVGERLQAGERVAGHVEGCDACRDRLRAMVSVRTLLAQEPSPPAPAEVVEAGAHARLRPTNAPPPLDPEAVPFPRRWPAAVVAAAVVTVVVVTAVLLLGPAGDPGDERVDALTKLPARGATLEVEPAMLEGDLSEPVVLRNNSEAAVEWRAVADQPWVDVRPARGRVGAMRTEALRIALSRAAPEGRLRTAVTITGANGSSAVVHLVTTVSNPPDVAATIAGCRVTAAVEDESEVAVVELHWGDGRAAMVPDGAAYVATLPASAAGGRWWVAATDALGNTGRTTETVLTAGAC